MSPIPKKLRAQMEADPYYRDCCITGIGHTGNQVEWHHNLTYAGRQVQEAWAILPVLKSVHALARNRHMRVCLDYAMLQRAKEIHAQIPAGIMEAIAQRWFYASMEIEGAGGITEYLFKNGLRHRYIGDRHTFSVEFDIAKKNI
jgi:hypothetical protein